jgi:transposase
MLVRISTYPPTVHCELFYTDAAKRAAFDCDFAAWIGIVPRQDSTGGKQKLGPISKRGDQYLRRILVVGAHAVLKRARHQPEKYPWVTRLLERKPFRVVAVAVANKMARVAWALLARGGSYRAPALAAAA